MKNLYLILKKNEAGNYNGSVRVTDNSNHKDYPTLQQFADSLEKNPVFDSSISFSINLLDMFLSKVRENIPEGDEFMLHLSISPDEQEFWIHELKRLKDRKLNEVQALLNKNVFNEEYISKCKVIQENLKLINEKAINLEQRGFKVAARYAKNFYENVSRDANSYFLKPTKENYDHFKKSAESEYNRAYPTLKKHRGYKQLLGNILLCILGLGYFYILAVWKNKGLFFQTDSKEKIDSAYKACSELPFFTP
jgi:hypothetical protein